MRINVIVIKKKKTIQRLVRTLIFLINNAKKCRSGNPLLFRNKMPILVFMQDAEASFFLSYPAFAIEILRCGTRDHTGNSFLDP